MAASVSTTYTDLHLAWEGPIKVLDANLIGRYHIIVDQALQYVLDTLADYCW
jgi:hypothetical protein